MKKLLALVLSCLFAFPATAQIVVRITATPTAGGIVSSKFRDGNDGTTAPTAPQLGPVSVISFSEADVPLLTASTGGTPPLTYELQSSTTNESVGFTILDPNVNFGTDGILRLSGLNDETDYWLRLVGIDSIARRSEFSAVQSFTTPIDPASADVTAPTTPTGLNCTSTISGRIDCSWTASTDNVGVTAYDITRGTGTGSGQAVDPPDGAVIGTNTGSPPATTFSDIGLTPGQEYYHRIRAFDAAGNQSGLTARDFTTVSSTTPPPQTTATPNYPDPVADVVLASGRTTENANNSAALTAALNPDPPCGTDILLAATTYTGSFTLDANCPKTNPVRIVGAANFTSILNGSLSLAGTYNIVTKVFFSGSEVGITIGGTNNKVIGNKITGWGDDQDCNQIAVSFLQGPAGKEGEAAYNEIYSPGPWGSPTTTCAGVTQNRAGLRTAEDTPADFHYDGWVHHNYIHDFPQKPIPTNYDSGQADWLEVGQTQSGSMPGVNSGWYVESNLIVRHLQGHGCFDAKVGGTTLRRNTMIDSTSTSGGTGLHCRMDHRTGSTNRSIFEANWLENSGGMTIRGTASLYGNVLVNAKSGIKIAAGNQACTNTTTGGGTNQACNVIMEGNTAGTQIGDSAGTTACAFPANNTILRNHTGSVTLTGPKGGNPCQTNTTNTPTAAPTRLFEVATKRTTAEVGPAALATAPAAYRNARCPAGSC